MALTKQKLLHKRSAVLGRVLDPSSMEFGEIAVNFAAGSNASFLEIKKADNKTALYFEHPYAMDGVVVSGDTAGYWNAEISGITEYYDGLTIKVRLGTTYNSYWNTLDINDLGSKIIWYRYGTLMTSHFGGFGAELLLTYRTDAGSFQATATTRGLISGTTYNDGWVAVTTYVDGNDTYQIRPYYARYYAGEEYLHTKNLCALDVNDKLVGFLTEGGTGSAKPVTTKEFKPDKIYLVNENVPANSVANHTNIYESVYTTSGAHTFNGGVTAYKTIYVKGKLNEETGLFKLSSGVTDWQTFVPYNQTALTLTDYFEEGWYYIRVGRSYSSANNYYLDLNNPLFYFDGANLIEVKPLSVKTLSAATSTIANSANTLTHKLTLKQNTTTIGDWNGGADKTLTFSDSATTYAGHYTPSNNATATTTGARITGITKDGKGHIISIATAATDNTDTATTESGHYTPTGSSTTIGSAGAGNFIKTITLDSKKHVTAITSGTALTSYTEASVTVANSGLTNTSPQPIVYGAVTGGTKGHSITLQRTNKTYSASTADSATTSNSATTALSASTAGNLKGTLNIYKNGTLLTSFNGSTTVSALTTDTNPTVTAGTVGTGVVTGITASGTSNHAIVGLKTTLVKVASATTADTAVALGYHAAATSNAYRNVWFSYEGQDGKLVVDSAFQYNPAKNSLKVSAITTNGTNQVLVPAKDGTIALTSDIDSALAGSVNYKGATSTIPASASTKVGDLWIAASAISLTAAQSATGAAQNAEIGDFLIARESGKWDVVQKNIDGAVTSTATSLTSGNVIIGKGNRTIGVSSYTIAKSVPSNALFTDSATTYAGHYTPSNDSTSTVSGARITGITKDGKGHIISIATAATDNVDTKVTSNTGTTKAYILAHTGTSINNTAQTHANAYVTAGKVYSNNSETVNLADAQTISGIKTFTNGIVLNTTTGWSDLHNMVPFGTTSTTNSVKWVSSAFTYNAGKQLLQISGFTNSAKNTEVLVPQKSGTLALEEDVERLDYMLAATANDLNERKQDKLVSGTNIKTVGGQSLLGSGDISISGITVNSANTLTHTLTMKQNSTTIGTWNGSDNKTVTFSDSATTYAGHYTPSNDSTSTVSGVRITGITKDGKGHIISIATAATDNTDTATTESGHYTPSTTASTLGSAGAGNFIKTITLDSKKHVLSITSGTALTSYTEASVAISNSGQTNNNPQAVVYGAVTGGTKGHSITLQRTNKVYSASTADSARTSNSATTAVSASTAGKLSGTLNIYKNGTLLTTYDGSSTLSALTTDTNPSVTAGTVGSGVVTGLTASGTSNHAIVGLKTTAVKVNSATTTDTAISVEGTAGSGDSYRNVWFSWSTPETKRANDTNFQYNPEKSAIKVSAVTMNGTNIIQVPNKAGTFALTSDLTGNTDTATTETGHYTPTGKTKSVGVATAGSFLKQVFYDSKGHVTSATTGTALTSFTETQLSYVSGTSVGTAAASVVTGITVSNHTITYGKTNKIYSATTADSARTLVHKLTVYNNGTSVGSFDGSAAASALTTDEKIKTATATTKAYIVGKAAVGDTSTGITHANAYMSGGALYSEGVKVSTTDTKVTDANSSGKTFLLGHSAQGTNATAQTYTNVYMSAGTISATEYKIDEKAVMKYNTTNQCIDFVFI